MIGWQRIVYYLGLALVEATLPALLLTIAGGDAWGLLIGVALLGALADWIVLRRLPPDRQRLALAGIGLLCALWVVKTQVAGDYGLVGGWGRALGAILFAGDRRSGIAYLSLLATLYCFWRGTQLTMHDRVSAQRVFRVIAISLLPIVGIGLFGASVAEARAGSTSAQVLAFFAVGLVTIALAGGIDEQEVGLHRLGWRGALIVCGAIGVMLALGVLIGSLFGRDIALIVRTVGQTIALIIALILAPLVWLIVVLLEGLLNATGLGQWLQRLPNRPPIDLGFSQPGGEVLAILPPWLQAATRIFFGLLPVVVILGLMLLARRRARRGAAWPRICAGCWEIGAGHDPTKGCAGRSRACAAATRPAASGAATSGCCCWARRMSGRAPRRRLRASTSPRPTLCSPPQPSRLTR